jgi:DNA-binding transcriptional regulator YhcF (GntR family)/sulfur transfer complex TusBCD TusB component (DsrH family)
MEILYLKKKPGVPKYKQIVHAVEEAITAGRLKKGDKLPSLNKLKKEYTLSRDTVVSAFNELKNRGILRSVVGKGYYVATEQINIIQKIFLLFDELNSFKEDLYNSFLQNLGDDVQVDIFFHHFNHGIFTKIINDNTGDYSAYVIMPANLKETAQALQNLPEEKVYILDQMHPQLSKYSGVYQNFKNDMYEGLQSGFSKIKKYSKLILVYTTIKQPKGLRDGFLLFCKNNNLNCKIVDSSDNIVLQEGTVYLLLEDADLLKIIKKLGQTTLVLGQNIGIISYNETMLKEIVAGGITTISTNFRHMGACLAEMVLKNYRGKIDNPSGIILRKSL